MPNTANCHEKNRSKVCLICVKKASAATPINGLVAHRIRQHFLPDFDDNDVRLPSVVCTRCRKWLLDVDTGKRPANSLPQPFQFANIRITATTRANLNCNCELCEIARETPIGKGYGPAVVSQHPVGRPPSTIADNLPSRVSISICQRCRSTVGRGLPHVCTLVQRRENLATEFATDKRGAQIHASDVVKDVAAATTGDSSVIHLATRGPRPLSLVRPQQNSTAATFSHQPISVQEFSRFQLTLSLSGHQTKLAAQFIRNWKGRNSIEPGLIPALQQIDRKLEELYDILAVDFDVAKGSKELRQVVFCKNPEHLIDQILQHRQLPAGDFVAKVGIDGGRSFLKICLSIAPVSDDMERASRSSYSTGACANRFRDSGVKKLLILAIVENVMESYSNLKTLLELLNIQHIRFACAMDFKVANAVLGIQSSSSSHPCPWCNLNRNEFNSPRRSIQLRSLGEIRANAQAYQQKVQQSAAGIKAPRCSEFQNCVQYPLFDLPDDVLVIDLLPPMELHLMLGIVSRLLKELDSRLSKMPGDNSMRVEDWTRRLGVQQSGRHGEQFSGNDCSRLLQNVDSLEQMLQHCGAFDGMPIIRALRSFRGVKDSCFGMKLREDFEQKIADFAEAYADLDIPVTPKVHTVIDHVIPFLKDGQLQARYQVQRGDQPECPHGLGFWSEQTCEAAHVDFSRLWSNSYKVDLRHPEYGSRLLKCVTVFSSRHL